MSANIAMSKNIDSSTSLRRAADAKYSQELLYSLAAARETGNSRKLRNAEQAVTVHYLEVATALAHRYRGRGVDSEDLVQIARIGLLKAVRGWQPRPDGGFLQYAVPMITGELRRYFRDQSSLIRLPRKVHQAGPAIVMARESLAAEGRTPTDRELAAQAGLPLEAIREDRVARETCKVGSLDAPLIGTEPIGAGSDWAERDLASVEDRALIRQRMARLTPRERKLIGLRFFRDRTQDQIGRNLGVSQMQVSRLLRDALDKMRTELPA